MHIGSLEAQNQMLSQLLNPKFLISAITQPVAIQFKYQSEQQASIHLVGMVILASPTWGSPAHLNWTQVWMASWTQS